MTNLDKAKTFEELYQLRAKHVSRKNVLYELKGDKEWIAQVIHLYNKLGFVTCISQPGKLEPDPENPVCKSHWHYMMMKCSMYHPHRPGKVCRKRKNADTIMEKYLIKTNDYHEIGQRASVSGYMMRDMAEKLYEKLRTNQNLIVRISCIEERVPEELTCMTITFKNGEPMFKDLKDCDEKAKKLGLDKLFDEDENFKKIPDIFSTHFSEGCYSPNGFSYSFKDKLPNLDKDLFKDNVVVKFQIMDKRWNDNSLLWTELLDAIQGYVKQ